MYFAPRGTICAKAQNFLLILPIESGIIKIVQKTIRRCVGMADEGDSKSLVLITRVGSTPTTGIKKEPSSLSGGFSFLSAACERVEQHGPAPQGERPALRAVAQCAGDPHHRPPACLGEFSFLSAACARVEQHGPAPQGERSALRAVAQCAGDPHHRSPSLSGGVSFFICGV